MRAIFLFYSLFTVCLSYKFLIFNPIFGHSHTTFMGRIADTLFEAGHDVTVLSPIIDETLINKTGVKSAAKVIIVDQEPEVQKLMEYSRQGVMKDIWTMSPDPIGLIKMASNMSASFGIMCKGLISNKELLASLKAEKFDVGFSEPFSLCGLGLFDHLEIPASIGSLSTVQIDLISWYLGEPVAASYVPSMTSVDGDQMTLFGRFKNAIGSVLGSIFIVKTFNAEAEVLTQEFEKDYTNPGDLIGQTSFMFTNANPYLNYPRPLIHKTVEIGGISVDVNNVGELGEKWDKVLSERNHTVFISFGSVAKSKDMPAEWKKSILTFCASMPEVTFIWKYEEESNMADHLPNVHLAPWLPQNALLADPRLSIFITHGGLGSTTEVAHLGKPAIMMPLFADQPRNAEMLARHGGALTLLKEDLARPEVMRQAVETILKDKSFAFAATRLANMLREQPISAKELVISHSEFVAKYGSLPQLDPYGRQLNILQYYLVDVIAFAVFVIFAVLAVLFYAVRLVFRFVCKTKKLKTQ